MSAENKAILLRYAELWKDHDATIIDEVVAPDFVTRFNHYAPVKGRAGFKQAYAGFRAAFPDIQLLLKNMVAEGDTVAVHWILRGTHKGPHLGVAPTGKRVEQTCSIFYRIVSGKIAEVWGDEDVLGLLQQMGAPVPTSHQAS